MQRNVKWIRRRCPDICGSSIHPSGTAITAIGLPSSTRRIATLKNRSTAIIETPLRVSQPGGPWNMPTCIYAWLTNESLGIYTDTSRAFGCAVDELEGISQLLDEKAFR